MNRTRLRPECIITLNGISDKDKFYIPQNLDNRFDVNVVYVRITDKESK
ncbi:MAG: hypothetical protein QOK89_00640 [Nitrososphaeraceae archaeon]|nr:hypothetical protein [Nitrososphaeraceae archaeon]